MHRKIRRFLPSLLVASAALTAAAAQAQAVSAAATTATSTPSLGMRYVANTSIGNGPTQNVVVTLASITFTIDDIVPIQAGTGCQPVSGDATKVTCVAYRTAPNGRFMPFVVRMSGGPDKARNLTGGSGTESAPMHAYGGAGDDRLTGAEQDDKLRGDSGDDILEGRAGADELIGGSGMDVLDGEDGNDNLFGLQDHDQLDGGDATDTLNGGSGPDVLVGGTGPHDEVSYRQADSGVTVDLGDPNASQGEPGEGDRIREVEDVDGSDFDDTIYGNADNNTLFGWAGTDKLHGLGGMDIVIGGFGTDLLFPSFAPDGFRDIVDCDDYGSFPKDGDNGDHAFHSAVDGDFIRDCENILPL